MAACCLWGLHRNDSWVVQIKPKRTTDFAALISNGLMMRDEFRSRKGWSQSVSQNQRYTETWAWRTLRTSFTGRLQAMKATHCKTWYEIMWALYKQEAHGAAGAYYNQNSTSLKACEFTGLFFSCLSINFSMQSSFTDKHWPRRVCPHKIDPSAANLALWGWILLSCVPAHHYPPLHSIHSDSEQENDWVI